MSIIYYTFRFLHFVGFILWGMGLTISIVGVVIAGNHNPEGLQKARQVLKNLAHPGMGLAIFKPF